MATKYFLYARKSTEDEERQIMSIEAQITELLEYAKRENIEIVDQFIESKSAKQPGRPVFNEMMSKIHSSKEPMGLLAWHPDRLARNSIDGGQIIYSIDTGRIVSLKFPTFWFEPTPQGLFILQVAFGQSKYYSDNLSENVKRGIRQKLRRGEWSTLAPIGYLNNSKTRNIEPDPIKARVIKKGFEEFAQGKHTLESLGKYLSLLGVESKTGKPLCKATIQRMLTNPIYTGIIVHNKESFEGSFEPIIAQDTFEAVQNILKQRAKPRKSKKKHDFPFTGLFKCGECGAAITAQYAHGNGGTYRYYRCTKKLGKCSQKYLREDILVDQLKENIKKIAISDDWADKMLNKVKVWEKEQDQSSESLVKEISNQILETDTKLDKLINSFLDNTIEKEIYLKKKEELIKTKKDLINKKSNLKLKGNNWLEPLTDWIKTAHTAKRLTFSKNFMELKIFVEKIGTNHCLLGKKASWNWENSLEILISQNRASAENSESFGWSG